MSGDREELGLLAADSDPEPQESFSRIRAGVGAGLLLALCAAFAGAEDAPAKVARGLPSRRRRGRAGAASGPNVLGLVVVEDSSVAEVRCSSNEFCSSRSAGTFCYDAVCAPCEECEHCWDGANGTCGSCGPGFPTKETIDCDKVDRSA